MGSKGSGASSGTNVLRVEKRVVDLELSLNELKEQIQGMDVSAVPEMKQKLDDVEDLIMVEQAAVLELKKLLESEKPAIPEDFEKKISEIETNLQNAVNKTDFDAKIESIEKEFAGQTQQATPVEIEKLYNKISQIEVGLSNVKTQTENISKDVEERIGEVMERPVNSKQSAIDIELLSSKIAAGKENLERLSRSWLDLELKIAGITKKMEVMEKNIEGSPERILIDGLKINRKEIVAANARIDSLERVARELMIDTRNFEKSIGKFESLEKISFLGKNIEDKLEKTKFLEEEVKRLQSRIQNIYNEVDNRIDKLRGLEKKYSGDMPSLVGTVETNRRQIESMRSVLNNLNGKIASLENIKPVLENRLIEIRKSLYPMINEGLKPIHKRADFIEKKLKETRTSEIGKILTDVTMKIAVIEERIQSLEKDDDNKMAEIRTAVREKLGEIRTPPAMDEYFKELVNRIIFLESRLTGIEKMMQERSNALPIIIE